MAQVEKTVLVEHSAAQMYALVDAVEQYPEFLPWCSGVDLLERNDTYTSATLHIDYHGIKQKFTTGNEKSYPALMEIKLVDGPFKHLTGLWRFIPLSDNACKIEFKLNYEFSSAFLARLIAPVFGHIAHTFVDAFVERADRVY